MERKIHLHKNQKVIVWRTSEDSSNPRVHDRLEVVYSYLRANGRVGRDRTKKVFEQDFMDEFYPTDETISIMFVGNKIS
jgi:hypothetical protein